MTNEQLIQAVTEYIEENIGPLRHAMSDLIEQYHFVMNNESPEFHSDVQLEFEVLVRRELADIIADSLALDPEQVFLAVEAVDIEQFLE